MSHQVILSILEAAMLEWLREGMYTYFEVIILEIHSTKVCPGHSILKWEKPKHSFIIPVSL